MAGAAPTNREGRREPSSAITQQQPTELQIQPQIQPAAEGPQTQIQSAAEGLQTQPVTDSPQSRKQNPQLQEQTEQATDGLRGEPAGPPPDQVGALMLTSELSLIHI